MKNKLWMALFVLIIPVFSGCQTTTTHYLGTQADREGVVSLSVNKAENQHWEDFYATVDYSFVQQGNQLDFEGIFSFSFSPQINYERVRDFKLKLFLLDENRIVVDYLEVVRTLSDNLENQVSFNYDFDLAENVTVLTFGYEGLFVDDVGMPFRVWELPKRNF
ncbi:MAG: hypothetical protein KAG12_09455 [Desulfuromusa sp.]|nr:hypothetical protein [Desulfuromusa sp.]